jgi:hypothetical protein
MMLVRETLDTFEMEYGLLLIQNTEAAASAAAAAASTTINSGGGGSRLAPRAGAAAATESRASPAVSSWGGDRRHQGGVLHPGMGSTSLAATLWSSGHASATLPQTLVKSLDSVQARMIYTS